MGALSLSKAWDETIAIVAREGRLLASVSLALIALPEAIMGVVGLPMGPQPSIISMIAYVVVILIALAAQVALNRLAIGPSVTVAEAISRGFRRFVPVVVVILLLSAALFILMMLVALALGAFGLIVAPGAGQAPPLGVVFLLVVFAALSFAVFQLVIPVAAAESGGPVRLFSRSWQLARGEYLRLLAFIVLVFIGLAVVGLAGQFLFGSIVVFLLGLPNPGTVAGLALGAVAGVIQAAYTVMTAVMLARIYVQLAGAAGAGVPKGGT